MAAKIAHYVLTLTGAVQQLSSVLPALTGGLKAGAYDYPCTFLTLQPGGGNANPIYVGDDNAITSTDYGFRLEAATAGVPPAPFVFDPGVGNVKVGDLFVLGTNGEKLHLLLVSA